MTALRNPGPPSRYVPAYPGGELTRISVKSHNAALQEALAEYYRVDSQLREIELATHLDHVRYTAVAWERTKAAHVIVGIASVLTDRVDDLLVLF